MRYTIKEDCPIDLLFLKYIVHKDSITEGVASGLKNHKLDTKLDTGVILNKCHINKATEKMILGTGYNTMELLKAP